ncbi:hypothetical protein ASPZODRAFT_136122 [Penicilliopsis zonata CBS 506.65]|uniref:N-acetylgalactosaminide beta-1,3-galactosyltransferase n=1 Tax=Penicilliopsis zonata CBS 506.65 TaxID=1073090 RepID=A0A1L9S935_9EURO|nr:hypothetical protein ASPZODRAFT_136122 [Penicilliopsis zonata CBS 506.65]OJJ43668.1 hypothetical protein ASPZODRAFT_136122 [Penicilliopsis zonata CBS 506.65]
MISLRSPSRRWILVVSPILSVLVLYYLLINDPSSYISHYRGFIFSSDSHKASHGNHSTNATRLETTTTTTVRPAPAASEPPVVVAAETQTQASGCPSLPGLEDVLVIMKTGVTEALEKVPVHIRTTLRCVPHYTIFSDFEEDIEGVRTVDVLRSVSKATKETDADFAIYNRVLQHGRPGLIEDDLHDEANSAFGKPGNPGWKLDKWKFLPMIDEALQARPEAKWYVFVEADTYMVWPNLVGWLNELDPSKPFFLGNQMQIADITFAYGGSGIIISNPAMRKLSQYRTDRLEELERYTAASWAGDCVLGKTMRDAGVPLNWAWPMLQSGHMWELDALGEAYGRKPWCYPVVSFHHMKPEDIETMWLFDQKWFQNGHSLLLHSDVYHHIIRNETLADRDDWNNLSADKVSTDDGEVSMNSAAECAARCADDRNCLQYSYENGNCLTSRSALRGSPHAGTRSGWMQERIDAAVQTAGVCPKAAYVTF